MVAPVTVYDGAVIGAGSVITVDIKKDDLAVCRSKQVNIKNGTIEKFIDKLKTTYKWFNLRDIDLSFLNKEEIKYY